MRNKRIIFGKCRVIFFDLEFYVPVESRAKTGFSYNPWDESCKILGGSFLTANPEKDFGISEESILRKTKSLWLWEHGSERELLYKIYITLKDVRDYVHQAHDGAVSPILCGIGITSSDVPILFELFKRFNILSNQEAFSLQNSFRVIDLSQLAVATFNNSNNFLYPKTKNHILNKYLPSTRFDSGKSVWDLYEANDYDKIQSRVLAEVFSTHKCYELIYSDLNKFKILEVNDKKRKSLERKNSPDLSIQHSTIGLMTP